jgi:DNA polymerase-3 subunit epsilon
MSGTAEMEAMAATLEASGDYRVLRRLVRRAPVTDLDIAETRLGVVVDFETTGLDAAKDEIIEIAMVPFTYMPEGRVIEIREPYRRLRQPSVPIPPEITAITGLDDAAVAGHVVDPAEVEAFAAPAVLIIAHNAAFDRPFAERFCRSFVAKPWACSMSQVDWAAEGFEGAKLAYLAASSGFFYDAHKATEDCAAVAELLARPLPKSGVTALSKLLEAARQPGVRIWAVNSPFPLKDTLKARGYHWSDGNDGKPKAWFIDVAEPAKDAELIYLRDEIYRRHPMPILPSTRITAFNRFSGDL